MPTDTNRRGLVRFDVYELDLENGELRKQGRPVRLQPQPFKVLAKLVSEPGRLVTREELQHHVWDDTFVDFERGLNFCIRQIRAVLADDVETPRFIETVPRRGYRFIAPLELVDRELEPRLATSAVTTTDQGSLAPLDSVGESADFSRIGPVYSATVRPRRWLAALAVLGCLAITGIIAESRLPSAPKVLNYLQITRDGAMKTSAVCCPALASDDSRVYFSEMKSGRWTLAQVSAQGGEVVPLSTSLHNGGIGDIFPAGRGLLATSAEMDGPLWVVPLPGGSAQRLADLLAHDATVSPDGKKLVYASGQTLYVANADGGDPRPLAKLKGTIFRPRWSIDQKVIRFTLHDPGAELDSLWEISSTGTNLRPLFSGQQNDGSEQCCGVWTPDGKFFVYQSTYQGQTNIWALPEDRGLFHWRSSNPVQLTAGPLNFLGPTPSQNGKRLFAIGQRSRGELMRYDPAARQFVSYLGGISAEGLDFSPDGQWVVYVSYPDGRLWRSRADGKEQQPLTPPEITASLPRWAPDGHSIVFTGSRSGGPWKSFVISAQGGIPEPLVPGESPEFDSVWSPDGKTLAFAESVLSPSAGIHLIDFATRRVSRLSGSDDMFSPRWSPDGRFLAVVTTDSLNLRLFDFSSQKWRTLVRNQHVSYPSWSRDGSYVYFRSLLEDSTPFFRVRVRDQLIERVAEVPISGNTAFSVSGSWSGLAPDDSLLFLRDTSFEEIYALEVRWP
ncbi:MAG TPA: winged helix-turn-helix domain-containing protein [Candidatus Sulfotelmatobacter sp.]